MPGGYGGYAPHVHFEIWGPRVSRQLSFVNLHQNGLHDRTHPLMDTSSAIHWRTDSRPRVTLFASPEEAVERGSDGVLRCTHDLFVEAH
jgi:hypothetical protein